jgi:arylsulfatase A-like enzyme
MEMKKAGNPNVLILWGDDIGCWNISYNNRGQMRYWTPNIDRIGNEGATFTDYYGQQSCTAGRAAFITGQNPIRTGLTKVGMPGADVGIRAEDPTVAELLKRWIMPPASSARTIWETRTSSSLPCMVSTSSLATCIT